MVTLASLPVCLFGAKGSSWFCLSVLDLFRALLQFSGDNARGVISIVNIAAAIVRPHIHTSVRVVGQISLFIPKKRRL